MKILIYLLMLVITQCLIEQTSGNCVKLKVKKEGKKKGFTFDFIPDLKKITKKIKEPFSVEINATNGKPFDIESVCFEVKGISTFGGASSFPPCVPEPGTSCQGRQPVAFSKYLTDTAEWTEDCILNDFKEVQTANVFFTPETNKGFVKNFVIKGCIED